ncbi:hypothetical protein ACFQZZ_13485 [Nocardia sp. GCM10030253]|uniref:hypothetical protein n=1 Tax=Nocardia sp. GCM10030253 TaxID=3273404 RepID=UPI003639A9B7
MTDGFEIEIRRLVDRVLSIQGSFTPTAVADACAVLLHESTSMSSTMQQYEGNPDDGPFSVIEYRGPKSPEGEPTSLVAMKVRDDVRVNQGDLRGLFNFSLDDVDVNPRIPPEGTVSYRERHGSRTLFVQFKAKSRLLRQIAVHENL